MYELDYQPERLDWNEYFVRYKETGEIKYFKEFLHFYESYSDRKVNRFIKRYELEDYRAEDLKQIFVTVLWEELQTYDSEIPLLQLIKFTVMSAWHDYVRINCGNFKLSAWHDYVRINCGNFKLENRHQYALLKKIAYLYYQKKENDKPLSQIISEIAIETDLTEHNIENYLQFSEERKMDVVIIIGIGGTAEKPAPDEIIKDKNNIVTGYTTLPAKDRKTIDSKYREIYDAKRMTVSTEFTCECGNVQKVPIDITRQFFLALY